MGSLKKGFPPVINKKSRVLILGSMPSEESLRKNEYYANPRNSFWKIISRLLEFDHSLEYNIRKNILLKNRIALWDVIKACERKGSLDSDIKTETITENDFISLFEKYPEISHVYFNGSTAEKEYRKRVMPKLNNKIQYTRLPSTSPAMAQLTTVEKEKVWSEILFHVKI